MYKFFSQFNANRYAKGAIILRGGDIPQGVYFVKRGFVKLTSVSKEGKELTMVIYKEGDFFPVVWAFFGGDKGSIYSFEAITETEILRAPRESFISYVTSHFD